MQANYHNNLAGFVIGDDDNGLWAADVELLKVQEPLKHLLSSDKVQKRCVWS